MAKRGQMNLKNKDVISRFYMTFSPHFFSDLSDDEQVFYVVERLEFDYGEKVRLKDRATGSRYNMPADRAHAGQIGKIIDIRFDWVSNPLYVVRFNDGVKREYLGYYLEKPEE